jgi:hypothetical protein
MEHMTVAQLKDYQRKHKSTAGKGKQISRAETNFEALYIQPRLHTGEIKNYRTQVTFELWPKIENLRRIVFTPDFVIEYADGRRVVVEMKGKFVKKMQREYHLRVRRFKELYPEYEYREEKSEDWS